MKTPRSGRFDLTQYLNFFSLAALGVVLVLFLIFFVVTPTDREWGPTRPYSRTAQPVPGAESDLVVYVLADGRLLIGRDIVTDQEISKLLQELNERWPGRQLVLEADRAAPYARVEVVFKAARDAGFPDVRVITGPRDILEGMQKGNVPRQ